MTGVAMATEIKAGIVTAIEAIEAIAGIAEIAEIGAIRGKAVGLRGATAETTHPIFPVNQA